MLLFLTPESVRRSFIIALRTIVQGRPSSLIKPLAQADIHNDRMASLTVCDVALDPKKGGLAAVWTYRLNEPLRIGDAVAVPLATRSELGFVLRVYEIEEKDLAFPLKSLRTVQSKIEGLSLPPELVQLSRFCGRRVPVRPRRPPSPPRFLLESVPA